MSELSGRKIIIGVTGSIAAYKGAILARELIKCGTTIRVAMTVAASHFIAPLTFASISRHPVALDMYPKPGEEPEHGSWHIEWGTWADAMVIAPASAATIAKLAAGLSDNALTVIATALRGKLFVAPAMDTDMYRYPALARNLATLRSFGVEIIPVGEGELASGLVGAGRLAEPEDIVESLRRHFARRRSLEGRHVVITAGPTHEPIDPVRYIGNHSSGKMGYALAEEARDRGARVTLVSGPTALEDLHNVEMIRVGTAGEMAAVVEKYAPTAAIVIAAAAVADFTPAHPVEEKMRRREMRDDQMKIELRPTRDILRSVGQQKRDGQIVVGFALETTAAGEQGTERLVAAARAKLLEKNCDMIVANSVNEPGAGFATDTNRVTLVTFDGATHLPMMSKRECAVGIFDRIERLADATVSLEARD
jgi:phosphopantothenoylcysteine decarboxylase/phosphopantothenate--cysteine ligase